MYDSQLNFLRFLSKNAFVVQNFTQLILDNCAKLFCSGRNVIYYHHHYHIIIIIIIDRITVCQKVITDVSVCFYV